MATRGIEPTSPTTSINPTDQASKRGVSAATPTAIVFPPPADRGVGVAPSSTETLNPR